MAFRTFDDINRPEWKAALKIYHQAFPAPGRKPDRILEGMFAKRLSFLHTESEDGEVLAMAVTGRVPKAELLLIDYLAVREDVRGRGYGRRFVRDIETWARDRMKLAGLLIEAEADPGEANAERIRFWERCGFVLTDYVHEYIWVPETYRAMYRMFEPGFRAQDGGRALFRHIEEFHKKAFAR
ncbi:GNAT family N-acetyltransferase [Cohnella caldifontis]|uniref:GNAT family N-acetyltransferase n=1 Tax=Cohnella caldifontis TaxID=3027471 RepID=UPI0023EC7DD5|nr:GNAT family N-acetyltransferase [Cohnella sp. YIM B05605]